MFSLENRRPWRGFAVAMQDLKGPIGKMGTVFNRASGKRRRGGWLLTAGG